MGGMGWTNRLRPSVSGASRLRPRSVIGRCVLVMALALFGQLVLWPGAASAATINVTSTADVATNFGACGSAGQPSPPAPACARRSAPPTTRAARQSVTINVPAGTYTLTNGELQLGKVSGSNITLNGAGSASTIIDGNHASRVLDLDPTVVGGVTTAHLRRHHHQRPGRHLRRRRHHRRLRTLHATLDNLTVTNSVFSNNQANFAAPTTSNKPGGGLQFQGGNADPDQRHLHRQPVLLQRRRRRCTTRRSAPHRRGDADRQRLRPSAATPPRNSGVSGTSGGALAVSAGAGGGTYTVTNSTFTGNTASSSRPASRRPAGRSSSTTGNLTVTGSTFTSNSVSGASRGRRRDRLRRRRRGDALRPVRRQHRHRRRDDQQRQRQRERHRELVGLQHRPEHRRL